MPAQNGRTLRIYEGDGADPEVFTLLACSREDSFNSEVGEIDITDKCSDAYRELLGGGIKSMSLSTSGVAKDKTILKAHLAGTIKNYRIVWEDTGDYIQGAYEIGTYSETGTYDNGSIEYTAEFRSSGEFTLTEAV